MDTIRKFGWRPDIYDSRDRVLAAAMAEYDIPPKSDLQPLGPQGVYDQGNLGSCTANAIGAADEFAQIKQGAVERFMPSRLFIYFNERRMEGTVYEDSGAMIRDGMKSLAVEGACPETEWPYDESQFTTEPTSDCYIHAEKHQAIRYQRVPQTMRDLRACLAAGYPIVFGFSVYENFMSERTATTGIMDMPQGACQGGHAVLAVGHDDSTRRIKVRNSWSLSWGEQGHFWMPYEYILHSKLASDFWTLRWIEV